MYSRAHLLIERDLEELMALGPEDGIYAFPLYEDNLFDVVAKIEGLPHTIWESGIFQIYMKFNENYNDLPPNVSFQTIPFHPNIDVISGKPSVDFLDDAKKWRPEYTIKHILQSLQQLLSNPLLDRAVNMDAVFMLKGNPDRYRQIAQESVIASQRIQKGLTPFPGGFIDKGKLQKDTQSSTNFGTGLSAPATPLYSQNTFTVSGTLPVTNPDQMKSNSFATEKDVNTRSGSLANNAKRISFEDYYRLWKGIATSKPNENSQNVYIQYDLKENPVQMAQHLGLTLRDLEVQMMQQLNEHKNIMYGKFNFKQSEKFDNGFTGSDKAINQINKMKNIYLNKDKENEPTNETLANTNTEDVPSSYMQNKVNKSKPSLQNNWENEVDDLVNWTQNLDDNNIA